MLALLCNLPSESFEAFSSLAREDAEKLLHLFEKTTPEHAMKQLLRVKGDILYALGREEELPQSMITNQW